MKACALGFAALVLATTSGCAARRTDLVQTGYVTLEARLPEPERYPPHVYRDGDTMVVEGQLGKLAGSGDHIHVTVMAPDGTVVFDEELDPELHVIPLGRQSGPQSLTGRRRALEHDHYSVRLPTLPPEGSTVRILLDKEHGPGPGR